MDSSAGGMDVVKFFAPYELRKGDSGYIESWFPKEKKWYVILVFSH